MPPLLPLSLLLSPSLLLTPPERRLLILLTLDVICLSQLYEIKEGKEIRIKDTKDVWKRSVVGIIGTCVTNKKRKM
ncbi:hypothetical protein TL16_g04465 [Triparma laevis f. inornata]|uniref:Uncharacterized protein n=1 Tax=Triparma laevis f. inornata TaxID=1714386 RepID=A0A9W7AAB7_9STRA|nr:hypothetical protein TL16_g04465 [Triparma laevis f. inornata]